MGRFVAIGRIEPGSAPALRAALRRAPPFGLPETTIEHLSLFVDGERVVLVFEGPDAAREAARLLADPSVLGAASRLGMHLEQAPEPPDEVFSWSRPELIEGVSFGAQAGPGDSE